MPHRIVPATEDLLRAMAPRLRPLDRREVETLGFTPERGLLDSYRRSTWARVALTPSGRPLAAWGLGLISALGGIGGPWMLSTPLIERDRRAFLRESRRQVAEMRQLCPILRGLVDARYRGAVRWLGWLGFSFGAPIEIGGAPFLPFEMR
jgi:hypothetical protein